MATDNNQSSGSFSLRKNYITGKLDWSIVPENYDYYQELSRSCYGDMLHDTERNQLYEEALSLAIKKMHDRGKPANVLDIGTGTGLLSMMAVRHGADRVVACEAFDGMARCAEKVIKVNGMSDKIKVISSNSCRLTAKDIGGRANILVAELFDTELIGENALSSFHHACDQLLESDRIVIPSRAEVIVQPASCPFFRSFDTFEDIQLGNVDSEENSGENNNNGIGRCLNRHVVRHPPSVESCPGYQYANDVQLDMLGLDQFVPIAEPEVIFKFDFSEKTFPLPMSEIKSLNREAQADGTIDCIFLWWQLEMDEEGKIILSTAPRWAHPTPNKMQWRDHWMQAVFYPHKTLEITKGQRFQIIGQHDDFQMWFAVQMAGPGDGNNDSVTSAVENCDVIPTDVTSSDQKFRPPCCNCGIHGKLSRRYVAMMNDKRRNSFYLKALKKIINKESVCFCLDDSIVLPIVVAKLGAKKVFVVRSSDKMTSLVRSYAEFNHVSEKVKVINGEIDKITAEDLDGEVVDTILAEPKFSEAVVPYHYLRFLYVKSDLISRLKQLMLLPTTMKDQQESLPPANGTSAELTDPVCADTLPPSLYMSSKNLTFMPYSGNIMAIAVEFRDLHKVKGSPVGTCQGFNIKPFDDLLCRSSRLVDEPIECHALWEYPTRALSPVFELLNCDWPLEAVRQKEREGQIDITGSGICNGIAIWSDFTLADDDDQTFSCGPLKCPESDQPIKWYPYEMQACYFFRDPVKVEPGKFRLKYKTVFKTRPGSLDFDFKIVLSPGAVRTSGL